MIEHGPIRDDIPPPSQRHGTSGVIELLHKLEIGQHVDIHVDPRRGNSQVAPYCTVYGRKWGRKFKTSQVESGVIRVWRIA